MCSIFRIDLRVSRGIVLPMHETRSEVGEPVKVKMMRSPEGISSSLLAVLLFFTYTIPDRRLGFQDSTDDVLNLPNRSACLSGCVYPCIRLDRRLVSH